MGRVENQWMANSFSHLQAYLALLLTRKHLPVAHVQHLLPDDLAHDLRADAKQVGEWGVRVVEAVQQNL